MKRTANIKKDLSTPEKLVKSKKAKADQLKKEIAYDEMRIATGTKNKFTLEELISKNTGAPLDESGHLITAGGAIYGE